MPSLVLVLSFNTVLYLSHSSTWKVYRSISFNGKLNQRMCARECKHRAKYAVLEICRFLEQHIKKNNNNYSLKAVKLQLEIKRIDVETGRR